MLWEAYQQTKIAGAERTAERAKTKADRYADDIADIRRQVNRLSLACQAMWELLRDHSDLTEEDIETRILEVDLRDGRADGKMTAQTLACPSCGRPTNTRRQICVICGTPVPRPHQFSG